MAKKTQTYGDAMSELQDLMKDIEGDKCEIDQLMEKVKRAAELIKFCKEQLTKTNKEVQKVLDTLDNEEQD